MNARIGRHEDIAAALIRILKEDFDAAQREFRGVSKRDERVHRVRQRLKRMRTILKIIGPAFGETTDELRRTLTEAARLLARARDADVAAASARAIAEAGADGQALGFDRVADTLGREAAEAHRQRTPTGEITMLLATAGAAVEALHAGFDGSALFSRALRHAYANGRRARDRAQKSLATPDLHRWRKRVKELGHLIGLARKRLPGRARKAMSRLGALDGLLGTDNDHALLAEKLALMPSADLSLMSQLSAIAQRRSRLEARSFRIGAKLYRRRPQAFARRFALG